ncbi:MAG: glycosyltransferase family 2 protein, partial [Bdellovibrionales bacterium]|nr:glycosyltransferase family 2 protein [Bdellovibrionales bacterium]
MVPLVSVIIPAHNRPTMLKRAAQSVLSQDYSFFELLVINDGSTESLKEIQVLVESAGHRFLIQDHKGVSAARNYGVAESQGEWIAFLDSDDMWDAKKLSTQVQFHRENPQYQLSQCEELWIRNGKRVNKRTIHAMARGYAFEDSLRLCCISPSSVMLSRKLFESTGGFDERMPVCEDYDLWLRITPHYEVGYIDTPLVTKYGGHDDQLSKSQPAMDRFRLYAISKLLLYGELSDEQWMLACCEMKGKTQILLSGAQNRDNHHQEYYREFHELSERLLRVGDKG